MSTRPLLSGGPAYFTHNGYGVQVGADEWSIDDSPSQFAVSTNLQGEVDWREEDTMGKLSAVPMSVWGATVIAKLFPYQPSMRGQNIFPATDLPLVVQTSEGESYTYAAAALSKMPTVTWAGNKVTLGAAEWTMVRRLDQASTVAGSYVTVAASTYTEPTLNPQLILTSPGTLAYQGLTDIQTEEDGIVFTPTVNLAPRKTSKFGVVNYQITSVTATVEFTPEGSSATELYTLLHRMDGTGTGRGTSLSGIGSALTVTSTASGGPTLSIPLALPTKGGVRFAHNKGRVTHVTLQAARKQVSGVLQPLFTLGTTA